MRTIAVIARKGGSGKSTVAIHLALAGHLRGRRVLVADTDAQRSASHVLRGRQGTGPELIATTGAKLFALQVGAQRGGTELVVIDTPAVVEEELSHAIVAADLCLLVVRPTFLDLAAAAQTTDIVRRLRKPLLVLMNQAAPARGGIDPPAVKRALQVLDMLRLPVVPTILRARAAYQSALDNGRSVEELEGQAEAAQEAAAIWDFISGFVFGRTVRTTEPAA
jgi:chromosome partitioning protein